MTAGMIQRDSLHVSQNQKKNNETALILMRQRQIDNLTLGGVGMMLVIFEPFDQDLSDILREDFFLRRHGLRQHRLRRRHRRHHRRYHRRRRRLLALLRRDVWSLDEDARAEEGAGERPRRLMMKHSHGACGGGGRPRGRAGVANRRSGHRRRRRVTRRRARWRSPRGRSHSADTAGIPRWRRRRHVIASRLESL